MIAMVWHAFLLALVILGFLVLDSYVGISGWLKSAPKAA